MQPTPRDDSSGWLPGDVVAFDRVIDAADRLIGQLAARAREGDNAALTRIVEVREVVRGLDGTDGDALAAALTRLEDLEAEAR
jgi:hypothetical protein